MFLVASIFHERGEGPQLEPANKQLLCPSQGPIPTSVAPNIRTKICISYMNIDVHSTVMFVDYQYLSYLPKLTEDIASVPPVVLQKLDLGRQPNQNT